MNDAPQAGEQQHESRSAAAYASSFHVPVLCKTVVERLVTDVEGTYVDATLGGGGHTAALLEALAPGGRVIGIDRDADAIDFASTRMQAAIASERFLAVQGDFGELETLAATTGVTHVDGILMDLGVSSHQIDVPDRGFSYLAAGPLDMRMDRSQPLTADIVVNQWEEEDLARMMREYGEETHARKIARSIVRSRPLNTTEALTSAIEAAVPGRGSIKHLSRVFQAIRIAVNGELESLRRALLAATDLVRVGGRCVVIAYHSLEDRLVKRYFRYGNFAGEPVHDLWGNLIAPWRPLTTKPVQASEDEVTENPRARSARLRAAERLPLLADTIAENTDA